MTFEGRKVGFKNGYPVVYWPEHNLAYDDGTAYIHRVVAEQMFGIIPKNFHVHHKDGNPCNWAQDNLTILPAREHTEIHMGCSIVLNCDYYGGEIARKPSGIRKYNYCDTICQHKDSEVIDWPSVNELLFMVEESSYVATGKHLGVSDNAVRKRIKNHSLGYIPSVL